ncbi:MAG: cell division protein FtsX, partial [Casimicrobiaceae bacterium]
AALRDAAAAAGRSPLGTALSMVALAAALALPLAAAALLDGLGSIAQRARSTPQLTVYLAPTASAKDRDALLARLKATKEVASVALVTKEQALAELQSREGVRDLLAGLSGNPLPDAVVVTAESRAPRALEALRAAVVKLPGADRVDLDLAWIEQVAALVRAGELVTYALAALLGVAVVAATFNTVRLQVLTRVPELDVASLFGATPQYLRRPFLYFGALQGLLAGLLAVVAVQALLWEFNRRIGTALGVFGLPGGFSHLSPGMVAATLAAALGLGWSGAWLAVSRRVAQLAS